MKLYGLIGYPLGHSFSASFFARKFTEENISDTRYELFPIPSIAQFSSLWAAHPDLLGLNVTIPYKESVFPFLDSISDVVRETGACNCIKKQDGKLVGYNTDVIGFEQSLEEHLRPHHVKALILGTGGASKAVQYVVRKKEIPFLTVSRNPGVGDLTYAQITAEIIKDYTLIINTTPLGMHPLEDQFPSLPYSGLGQKHLLFDLIYNPARTRFLQKGIDQGASVCNGERMLVIQAEESWKIWNS